MKAMRKIIEIDEERCDGCGQCVLSCAEGAIQVVDGKARLVSETYCDGLGACLGECPQGALRIAERAAAEFDPEAVERYVREKKSSEKVIESVMPCGCPSTHLRSFDVARPQGSRILSGADSVSVLSHWPVQIRLVPADAPFLKGASLLVAADCTPVAYPHFHRDFVAGMVVLLGCPKFDDAAEYTKKFAEIFKRAGIRAVTVLDMEVPCCAALPLIVKKGMEAAGKEIPVEEVVIGVRGVILDRRRSTKAGGGPIPCSQEVNSE